MSAIVPAGHDRTAADRARAAEKERDLEAAVAEIRKLSRSDIGTYHHALNILRGISFSLDELHGFFLQQRTHTNDGYILSAAYNLCDENIIQYDLDVPLASVGFGMRGSKLLINRGKAGDRLGFYSYGAVINIGACGRVLGSRAGGTIVNAGGAISFGKITDDGIVLTLQDPEKYRLHTDGLVVYYDRIQGKLRRYLEELAGLCNGPPEQIYKRYGNNPSTTIQHDIRRLLKENER